MIRQLSTIDAARDGLDISGASVDILLLPGETAVKTFSAVNALALGVVMTDGLYEVELCGDVTVAAGACDFHFQPNGAYQTGEIDWVAWNSSAASGTPAIITNAADAAFSLGDGRVIHCHMILGKKGAAGTCQATTGARNATTLTQRLTTAGWATASDWATIGTFQLPTTAQSGRVSIRRIA